MTDQLSDDLPSLIAHADAELVRMQQSPAMRGDFYPLALSVLVSVTQLLATVARKVQGGALTPDERDAVRTELLRAAGHQGRNVALSVQRRTAVWMGCAVGGAFVAGALIMAVVGYLAFGARPVVAALPGDVMLCQASAARVDAEGRRWFPALAVRLETALPAVAAPRR